MNDAARAETALAEYMPVPEWRKRYGAPVFPNDLSVNWFIKMNRPELVASGALIPRAGRSASLLSTKMFPRVVLKILKRRARARQSQTGNASTRAP